MNQTDETVIQNDSSVFQATLTDSAGAVIDDATAEYRLTVKKQYSDADGAAVFSTTATQTTPGNAFLTVGPSDLSAVTPPAVLVYDVKVRETSGRVTTVSRSKFKVLQSVRQTMP